MEIVLDTRGCTQPETFDRTIEALARLAQKDTLVLIADRESISLYDFLAKNNYRYETQIFPDKHHETRIWEP